MFTVIWTTSHYHFSQAWFSGAGICKPDKLERNRARSASVPATKYIRIEKKVPLQQTSESEKICYGESERKLFVMDKFHIL